MLFTITKPPAFILRDPEDKLSTNPLGFLTDENYNKILMSYIVPTYIHIHIYPLKHMFAFDCGKPDSFYVIIDVVLNFIESHKLVTFSLNPLSLLKNINWSVLDLTSFNQT